MRRLLLIFMTLSLLIACSSRQENRPSTYALNYNTDTKIIGTWKNVSLWVEIRRNGGAEIIEISEENWEEKLNMKPVKTQFFEDHTYISEYRDLNDSIIRITEGSWEIMGDSLFIDQLKPSWESYAYKFSIARDMATFTSSLDWDGDGMQDSYIGVQRKYYR